MSQLLEVATLAQSYQQAYQSGQMSAEEYKELINDLNVAGHINENAAEIQQNQEIYQVLMAAVQLAGALSS
jgi:hypothetical protein